MFRNHLQTAWRGLFKNPLYSAINIGGLALALCACMLILLYVLHEYSFDRFERNGDRIFAIYPTSVDDKSNLKAEGMSFASGTILQSSSPDVESMTRVTLYRDQMTLEDKAHPDRVFSIDKPLFADANFFSQFSFPLVAGNPASCLARPFSIVLTKTLATTLFGKENPVGKVLVFNNKYNLEVTGVAAEPPSNSYIDFNAVCSLSSYPEMNEHQWWLSQDINFLPGNFKTYVRLKDPTDTARVGRVMAAVSKALKPSVFLDAFGTKFNYTLSPLHREHMRGFIGRVVNTSYLKIFSLVAILILILALINYMSLATARASIRAREIGVRKTLGAGKWILIGQFFTESTLCTSVAFVLGGILYILFRREFLGLIHVGIDPGFGYSPAVLASFGALLLGTILVSGAYPSFVLSSLKPAETPKGAGVRKVLTVLQFSIATGLIIALVVMKQQLYFFVHKDIGMNRDNIVMIPYDETLAKHAGAFRDDIASLPGVQQTATSASRLFRGGYQVDLNGGKFKGKKIPLNLIDVDTAAFSLLQLHWKLSPLAGAWTSPLAPIVLNETAVRSLGLPADPRGIGLAYTGDSAQTIIVGVVRDFAFASLEREIGPVALEKFDPNRFAGGACLLVKVAPGTYLPGLLDRIRNVYSRYPRIRPFDYSFADEEFDKLYQSEDRMAGLLGVFSSLAIIVACLGLFGLATFSTLQRTKEIGIRKVLGAEVSGLVALLVRDFLRLVALAVILAWPIAWWMMHDWLQQYAYRIDVSFWVLAGAGTGIAVLSLLTVGSLALKAARANPVNSLRTQ